MSRLRSVLVTGATTPLGLRLCSALVKDGAQVLAVAMDNATTAQALLPDSVAYQQLDLSHPRELHDLLFGVAKELKVETVYHLATHRRLHAKGRAVHALNVEALRHLLAHCEAHPTINRLIYRSFAEVYRVEQSFCAIVSETQPLDHSPSAPQWLRDRVEADQLACSRMGMTKLEVLVLRCADIYAPDAGSQMYDYLRSRVCLRPLGFDPMINLLALDDAARALVLAGQKDQAQGVYNIRGHDLLPLAACVRHAHRMDIALPGPLVSVLYSLRRRTLRHADFSYRVSGKRMHFPSLLDGRRAADAFGYKPQKKAL